MADNTSNNERHSHWFAVAAFSTIALVSMTSSFANDIQDEDRAVKWAVSAVSISLVFSALAVFANFLLKDKFVGTLMEGGLALLTFGFWASVMPAINDPDNNLAVTARNGGLDNQNLYFSSWLAFFTSFYVLFRYVKHARSKTEGVTEDWGSTMHFWAALLFTSFVVMIASARLYDDWNCDKDRNQLNLSGVANRKQDYEEICARVKYSVSVGTISTVVAIVWMVASQFFKGRFSSFIELFITWFVFIMWIFAITYTTFSDKAPARGIGNLYFFSWLSFGLCVYMAMMTGKNWWTGTGETTTTTKEEAADKKPEMQEVENVEEDQPSGEEAA